MQGCPTRASVPGLERIVELEETVITVGPVVTAGAGWLLHIGVHSHPALGVSLYDRTGHICRLCAGNVPFESVGEM